MFDEFAFRTIIRRKGKTLTEIAKALGISKATLYRKMCGESDFYRQEIQECCEFLGFDNLNDVFFAPKVT